jgi:hypothetical protein
MNLLASLLRTLVPIVAGLILGLAARFGLDLDDATVTAQVTAALTGAYYTLWRALEALAEYMAWRPLQLLAGVLLGWANPPQYQKPVTAPVRLKLDTAAFDHDLREALKRVGVPGLDRP